MPKPSSLGQAFWDVPVQCLHLGQICRGYAFCGSEMRRGEERG